MYKVFENCIDNETLAEVWREIDLLSPNMISPEQTGAAKNKKSGKGVMIPGSICESAFPAITSVKEQFATDEKFTLLINKYSDGDYYQPHTDTSKNTLNIVLAKEENSFTGGSFKFTSEDVEIPFKNNTAIFFDSSMLHEVTTVKTSSSDAGRYSLTFFLY
jgi:hypothetical protein